MCSLLDFGIRLSGGMGTKNSSDGAQTLQWVRYMNRLWYAYQLMWHNDSTTL